MDFRLFILKDRSHFLSNMNNWSNSYSTLFFSFIVFYCLDVEVFRDITKNGGRGRSPFHCFSREGEGGVDVKTIARGRRDSLGIEETKPRRL